MDPEGAARSFPMPCTAFPPADTPVRCHWPQIRMLVECGCIKPLCDLLSVNDARIVTVALEGLENVLKVGVGALVLPG